MHQYNSYFEQANTRPGTCNLSLKVIDAEERIEVGLLSRTLKVHPANALLRGLDSLDGVTYKVA